MTARLCTAIASTALAATVAVALATSGRAETADPSKQTATPTATPTTSSSAARVRPRGVVADCSKGSGIGAGSLSKFRSRGNLVVGPLAMTGAAVTPGYGGNKFPLYVRGGHRVTVEVSPGARSGPRPKRPRLVRDGYRVVTFIACRRGEFSPGLGSTAGRVSFWSGGVLADSPRCVPLLVWVDDERSPRRAVIDLGVGACG